MTSSPLFRRREALITGLACAAGVLSVASLSRTSHANKILLNVSYDSTRKLYQIINTAFLNQNPDFPFKLLVSNGGSRSQALSIVNGEPASIATLGDVSDFDFLAKNGLIDKEWRSHFPFQSSPYHSTIVFLVRKGNPKHIYDWSDLARSDIEIITPNPKTSSGAKWNYLAAWGWAIHQWPHAPEQARNYMKNVFSHVPVFDTSARSSTNTFVRREIGDVLLAWETDAMLSTQETGKGLFDIVIPSRSILAQPSVAIVEHYTQRHGLTKAGRHYLEFLYTPEGQTISAHNFFRPSDPAMKPLIQKIFADISLFSLSDLGSMAELTKEHFAPNALFDQIQAGGRT
ncbi:sulfate ABC transporter substrate-binding protein [Entomobacter blattae]|uniref:Sulfate-binding protein n=1 Tax=Entomobacter blattae TaxID=2762277 RepID=A0A7H1NTV5_9PROT|nr:sulfate ABC transporter substrate-binding protein [Entomobacter blattae]QNT79215.1 Sulfate-binding protein [Entomobacter blattae]